MKAILVAEEIGLEDLEAASQIFDSLTKGEFYEKNEKAACKIGFKIRYIGKREA
jgi:hypothetical protein